ncbi:MAG: outer membrane lipid asymmetry maintenance protein MlaD [Gammaproteobacteria bacterium]|jgi:phospholipid/cholesterol/gamma-HCH transport system substrate-binding protein
MSKTRKLEVIVGAFMVLGFVALFFLAMQVSNLGTLDTGDSYTVTARFDNIGGLKVKAPVTLAGVEVGRVKGIRYDEQDFRAVAELSIYSQYDQIPDDTFAKILTAGLLGEQYIGLDPGGSLENLKNGSEIVMTQSALVLEEVIGQFIFSKAQEGGN